MRRIENYCNGCPECKHCGLDKDVEVITCDWCGDFIREGYDVNSYEVCRYCYDRWEAEELDDDGNEVIE